MSQARDLADLGSSAEQGTVAGDNLIINGDMAVNQRGDSTGITASGYYACDRFRLLINSLGTWSVAQNTSAPDGFGYSQRYDCTTADASPAAGDFMIVETRLEGQDLQQLDWGTSSAKKITLSFWVKSNKTGTYVVEMSHDSATLPYNSLQYTIDSADTWEYKTLTFSGDTASSTVNSNAVGLYVNWWIGAGTTFTSGTYNADTWHATSGNRAAGLNVNMADSTSNDWSITGVKLEVGSTATPFKHESYAKNLTKCQRYFQRFTDSTSSNGFCNGTSYTTTAHYFVFHHPVRMRTRASIAYSALSDFRVYTQGAVTTPTTIDFQGGTDGTTEFYCNTSSIGSSGNGIWMRLYTSNSKFDFSAEL